MGCKSNDGNKLNSKSRYANYMYIMTGIILYKNCEAYHQWCELFQFLSWYAYCTLYSLCTASSGNNQQLVLAQGLECEVKNLSQLVMCTSMCEFYLTNKNCQKDKSAFIVYTWTSHATQGKIWETEPTLYS